MRHLAFTPSGCLLVCATLAAACVPDTAVGPTPTSARPSASATATADATSDASPGLANASPRAPMPPGPAKWKTVPREQNGFYAVLDGLCSDLGAGRVGKDVVVHYGGAGATIYNNGHRRGAASFIALRDDGLESIGDPHIASPTGIAGASLDDFWVADSTGTRTSEGAILHRHVGSTWKQYAKDQTNIHAWVDGGVIGSLGFAAANGDIWVEGSTTKPPASLHADLPFPRLAAFPSGDVLVVAEKGRFDNPHDPPLVARHWAPGKKVTEHALDKLLPGTESPWVYEVAPDEVYVVRGDRTVRWDGTSFHALARTNKNEAVTLLRRAGPDDLWALTAASTLQRINAISATVLATPEPVVDMDGIDHGGGSAWIVGKSGKLFRREGEEWKAMPLPVPVFSAGTAIKAKGVIVLAPDDVLLTGMYWEKAPGWRDQELHTALFRTKPVLETLRCNEPDPENNNINIGHGFQSWPPMATAACTTPFAVLARRSNAVKSNDDWPRIRAALKGHTELGEVTLVELVSGDRTFVGAKAKDLETAKKLVALVAQKDRLRPEIVCGDPTASRSLAIDLDGGVVAK